MERRKLFSTEAPIRRRLFSEEPVIEKHESEQSTKAVICMDCGYRMETASGNIDLVCPKCGGKRFNVIRKVYTPEVEPEEVPINVEGARSTGKRKVLSESEEDFQKAFTYTSDPLELKLREFSGKTLGMGEFEKEFAEICTAGELEARGFCSISENGEVIIPETAFYQSRLFSKLTITVTRELDLDPAVMECKDPFKRDLIDKFSEEGKFSPRGIIIIKKGHGLPTTGEHDEWLQDSGICKDLKLEFGGHIKELPEFKKTINERYPDAPEEILRLLSDRGVIRVSGDNVEISK